MIRLVDLSEPNMGVLARLSDMTLLEVLENYSSAEQSSGQLVRWVRSAVS